MTVQLKKLLTTEEFQALNRETIDMGMYNMDRRVFIPGTTYEMDWYFDPTGQREASKRPIMFKLADRDAILTGEKENTFLSMYYWKQWSHVRPPIAIIVPNGKLWEIDRLSLSTIPGKHGEGWEVTGDFPNISVTPSIVVPGYHGWLQNGVFSSDLEGRGPNGLVHTS